MIYINSLYKTKVLKKIDDLIIRQNFYHYHLTSIYFIIYKLLILELLKQSK